MKTIQNFFLAIITTCSLNVYSQYDFTLTLTGPSHVYPGDSLFLESYSQVTEGTPAELTYYTMTGQPASWIVSYPSMIETCCGPGRGYLPGIEMVRIEVPADAAPGEYPLILSMLSTGITHTAAFSITVDPSPAKPARKDIHSFPPIPMLEGWESNMMKYGLKMCDKDKISSAGLWDGGVQYYDGTRVFYQISDYTGNKGWDSCACFVKSSYRTFIIDYNGSMQGYRVFPHGMYIDYQKTHEDLSRSGVILLANHSAFAHTGGGISFNLSRETAYLINAYRLAKQLNDTVHRRYLRSVCFALGHIEQWSSGTADYVRPFMAGLTCEALIGYQAETGDLRVLPAVKKILDWIWANCWIESANTFQYTNIDTKTLPPTNLAYNTGGTEPAPDLNMLIAPAFAWLWKMTGDTIYQQRGDSVFAGGVTGAWLDQGKQFSQNYRWSFDYVKWRTYKDTTAVDSIFSLTVVNGSGSGQYKTGQKVAVSSNLPSAGKMFFKWTGDIAGITNANEGSTTITMPSANTSITATYKNIVGLDNNDIAISFYPNPVHDVININQSGIVSVYDLNGVLQIQKELTSDQLQINVANLPTGIYIIKINNDKELKVGKFIKE